MTTITTQLAHYIDQAAAGVDYSPRYGARCPCCGRRAVIYKSMPWEEDVRVRYHRCTNPRCLLAAARATLKSVQMDGG